MPKAQPSLLGTVAATLPLRRHPRLQRGLVPAGAVVVPYAAVLAATSATIWGALAFCLAYATAYHAAETTATHCRVPNVVPSISAVIGGVAPERYVWRLAVAAISTQRLLDGALARGLCAGVSPALGVAAGTANTLENLALWALTYVSSTESAAVHQGGFVVWVLCSLARMAAMVAAGARLSAADPSHARAHRARRACAACFAALLPAACLFFYDHNATCRPYAYSLFAACEWLLVAANVAFNHAVYVDAVPHTRFVLYVGEPFWDKAGGAGE